MATEEVMPRSAALREALQNTRKDTRSDAALLSVDEARQRLGIGKSTLYLQMREGKLPYIKIGRRRLISPEALGRFIEQREKYEAQD